MAKFKRQIERKIDRRHAGHHQGVILAEKHKIGSSKGLRLPGSRNPKKQG